MKRYSFFTTCPEPTEVDLRLDREVENIELNTLNLQAMTEKLLRNLSDSMPREKSSPFLHPYID